MGLGVISQEQGKKKRTYLTINKAGKVRMKLGSNEELFDYIEGELGRIYSKTSTYQGKTFEDWIIELNDKENGDVYALSFAISSGVFRSIILCLASDKDNLGTLRIEPYEKGGYVKVRVYNEGTSLDWVTKELPPIKEVSIGGRIVKDDSERVNLIKGYVEQINEATRARGSV